VFLPQPLNRWSGNRGDLMFIAVNNFARKVTLAMRDKTSQIRNQPINFHTCLRASAFWQSNQNKHLLGIESRLGTFRFLLNHESESRNGPSRY